MIADPWGFPTAEPEHRWITRAERIEQAAEVLSAFSNFKTRREAELSAVYVLSEAYPIVTDADEIEALPVGTLIINERGTVKERTGGPLERVGEIVVGTDRPWQTYGTHTREKLRDTSEQLAKQGPWTVVHRQAEA